MFEIYADGEVFFKQGSTQIFCRLRLLNMMIIVVNPPVVRNGKMSQN